MIRYLLCFALCFGVHFLSAQYHSGSTFSAIDIGIGGNSRTDFKIDYCALFILSPCGREEFSIKHALALQARYYRRISSHGSVDFGFSYFRSKISQEKFNASSGMFEKETADRFDNLFGIMKFSYIYTQQERYVKWYSGAAIGVRFEWNRDQAFKEDVDTGLPVLWQLSPIGVRWESYPMGGYVELVYGKPAGINAGFSVALP